MRGMVKYYNNPCKKCFYFASNFENDVLVLDKTMYIVYSKHRHIYVLKDVNYFVKISLGWVVGWLERVLLNFV